MSDENSDNNDINTSFSIYDQQDMSKLTERQQLLVTKYRNNVDKVSAYFKIKNNIEVKTSEKDIRNKINEEVINDKIVLDSTTEIEIKETEENVKCQKIEKVEECSQNEVGSVVELNKISVEKFNTEMNNNVTFINKAIEHDEIEKALFNEENKSTEDEEVEKRLFKEESKETKEVKKIFVESPVEKNDELQTKVPVKELTENITTVEDQNEIKLKHDCFCSNKAKEYFPFVLWLERSGKLKFEVHRLKKRFLKCFEICQCKTIKKTFDYLLEAAKLKKADEIVSNEIETEIV